MSSRPGFAVVAAGPVALLLAAISLGGLLSGAYSRETSAWTAQAIGQDWFDLLIAAPWLAVAGFAARRGSYRWRVLLAGAYSYTVYEMLIYAFAVHFNALFLVYCATLGLAGYGLVGLAIETSRRIQPVDRRAARLAGGFLVTVGALFALLWLAEDLPAILHGETPRSLVETGLLTNPVHVIDFAFVLPAHVLAGILVWRREPAGELLAPIVLAFDALMAASIGTLMLVMHAAPVMFVMFGIAIATIWILARTLRGATPVPAPHGHC